MPRINAPCHEDWSLMTPEGRGRRCASCDKVVIDIAAMPEPEAKRFVTSELPARLVGGERLCVRGPADYRGRLLRPGQRLLTNGLSAVLAVAIAGCTGPGPQVGQPQAAPQQQTQIEPSPPQVAGGLCAPVEMGDVATPAPPAMGRMMGTPAPTPPPTLRGEAVASPTR